MLVLRWKPKADGGRLKHNLITLRSDGTEIRVAVPEALWSRGGHHPNWCPDGETLMMNLNLHLDGLRFVRVRYDGTDLGVMVHGVLGSGHPTLTGTVGTSSPMHTCTGPSVLATIPSARRMVPYPSDGSIWVPGVSET